MIVCDNCNVCVTKPTYCSDKCRVAHHRRNDSVTPLPTPHKIDAVPLPPTKSERLEYLRSVQKAVESKWVKPNGESVKRATSLPPLNPSPPVSPVASESIVEESVVVSEFPSVSPFGKPLSGQVRECPICYKSVPVEWANKHYTDRHGDVGGA